MAQFLPALRFSAWHSLLIVAMAPAVAMGANWSITPRVSAEQTWSDNIEQNPRGSEHHDFVTQIIPGIGIAGSGRRLRLNFDYQASGIRYARGTSPSRIDHRLQSSGQAELYRDHLFLDFSSTVSQRNTDNQGRLSSDTITANSNRETVVTFQASPYWVQRFGRYADATLRYRGGVLQNESASDTDLNELTLAVNSGSAFPQFPWTLDASVRREENNNNGRTTSTNTFKDVNGSVRHQFNRTYGIRLRAGYEKDELVSSRPGDGLTWAVTGLWTPTPRTDFEAGVQKQTIGTSLLLNARHRMRRAAFSLDYNETVTTTAQRQFDRQLFPLVDAFGEPIENPGLQQVDVPIDEPSLREETLISRRLTGSMTLQGRRSSGTLNINHERRTFGLSGDDETIVGVRLSATRSLPRNASLFAGATWQLSKFSANREDTRYGFDMGYSRQFAADLSGSLTYRYTKNSSDNAANEFTENRLSARVTMLF